ncbi:MAG: AI-2E family transporter [Gemmatimonadota bacterium]
MSESIPPQLDDRQRYAIGTSIEAVIRIGLLLAIAAACYVLLKPFFIPVAWGAILAVALYLLFARIRSWLGGRNGLAAILLSLVAIVALLVPVFLLSESLLAAVESLRAHATTGSLHVPPPPESVADWPVIGEQLYAKWSQAYTNLAAFVEPFRPRLRELAGAAARLLASGAVAVLYTIVALGIAGVFLAKADLSVRGVTALVTRVDEVRGARFVHDAGGVIRSVAVGVIGTAVIQAGLSWAGMALAGVPLAPLWALLVLVFAIAQLPPLLVLAPVAIYVILTTGGLVAVLFSVWAVLVSASDGILKPLLLGRGLEVPTLVILLGAIGGMLQMGVIGLFIGAVILAIGWDIMVAWVSPTGPRPESETTEPEPRVAST